MQRTAGWVSSLARRSTWTPKRACPGACPSVVPRTHAILIARRRSRGTIGAEAPTRPTGWRPRRTTAPRVLCRFRRASAATAPRLAQTTVSTRRIPASTRAQPGLCPGGPPRTLTGPRGSHRLACPMRRNCGQVEAIVTIGSAVPAFDAVRRRGRGKTGARCRGEPTFPGVVPKGANPSITPMQVPAGGCRQSAREMRRLPLHRVSSEFGPALTFDNGTDKSANSSVLRCGGHSEQTAGPSHRPSSRTR